MTAINGYARGSSVAYDSKNGVYLIVSAFGTLNGRFMTAGGQLVGSPFLIYSNITSHFPRAAYSPDANGGAGGFLVTWHESTPAGGATPHSRTVAYVGGAPVFGAVAQLSGEGSWWESGPNVAYSTGSKEFLVVWHGAGIKAQRVNNAGAPLGANIAVTPATYHRDPSVAYNPVTNEFLVVYCGYDYSGFAAARRIAAGSGALVGGATELNRSGGTYISDVAYNSATNTYLASWYDISGGTVARVLNAAATPVTSVILVSSRYASYDGLGVAYGAHSGTYMLVAHDTQSDQNGVVEINASGIPDAGFVATAMPAADGNFYPRITAHNSRSEWLLSTATDFAMTTVQRVQSDGVSAPSPAPPPPPPAAPAVTALTSNRVFPVPAGSFATWTATATGGTAPLEYQFERWRPGAGWTLLRAYAAQNSVSMGLTVGEHKVRVTVRTANAAEGTANRESASFFAKATASMSFDGALGAVFTYNPASAIATPYAANGNGFTPWASQTYFGGAAVHAADFDGNGLTDFILYNSNTGHFARATDTGAGFVNTFTTWPTGMVLSVLDFNGDGLSDVFRYNPSTGAWAKCMASASSDFNCSQTGTWARNWQVIPADFNGDGRADLFLYNNVPGDVNAGRWARVISQANGTFLYLYGALPWATDWQVHAADFNGDGRSDLFLYRPNGQWFKVFFNGNDVVYVAGVWGAGWQIKVGDFNGDNRSDLFLYNPSNGRWFVVIATFDGQFMYHGGTWARDWVVSVADLNGNSVSDVLLYNATTGQWFKAITIQPGVFGYSNGSWSAGLTVVGSRTIF